MVEQAQKEGPGQSASAPAVMLLAPVMSAMIKRAICARVEIVSAMSRLVAYRSQM